MKEGRSERAWATSGCLHFVFTLLMSAASLFSQVMLLAFVLLGRALEGQARAEASSSMQELLVKTWNLYRFCVDILYRSLYRIYCISQSAFAFATLLFKTNCFSLCYCLPSVIVALHIPTSCV